MSKQNNAMLTTKSPTWVLFALPLATISTVGLWFIYPWSSWQFACSIFLPLYLIHQFEEHHHQRFRQFINIKVFEQPKDLAFPLSDFAIFWINIGYVWLLYSLLILIGHWDASLLVCLPIISMLNGLSHIGTTLLKKCYNPGLFTSFLFVILGIIALDKIPGKTISLGMYVSACLIGVLVHLSIITTLRAKITKVTP